MLDEEDLIPSRVSIFLPEQKEKSAQIISDNPISGIWNRANGKLIIAERYPLGTQLKKLSEKNDAKNFDGENKRSPSLGAKAKRVTNFGVIPSFNERGRVQESSRGQERRMRRAKEAES